jgi:hypothetical protein
VSSWKAAVMLGVGVVALIMVAAASPPLVSALVMLVLTVVAVNRGSGVIGQRDGRPVPDAEQLIGRHGPSGGPQLVGRKCAYCDQKILTAVEATACRVCNESVHVRCRKDHRVDAHRPKSGAPYR